MTTAESESWAQGGSLHPSLSYLFEIFHIQGPILSLKHKNFTTILLAHNRNDKIQYLKFIKEKQIGDDALKPLSATCIPGSKMTMVWALASHVISNFSKVEASVRSRNINAVVTETYQQGCH